jgi:PTH1 family peptidyl-tRNA hydrolase
MQLLVGLGNPGASYAKHRHNIGFMAIDALAARWRAPAFRAKFEGLATEAVIDGLRVLMLKPETYMNDSGRAVGAAMRFHKIPLASVTVFHDELDLKPGEVRVKTGGGNAGHNGLRSITALCGNDYHRVRIGIGHPGDKALVHGHVLSPFDKGEWPWVHALSAALADETGRLVHGDRPGYQARVTAAMAQAGHPAGGAAKSTG